MLKYTVVKQRDPLGEGKKEMYYPRLTGREIKDINDLAEIITLRSSLSKGDIVSTLVSLEVLIPELLSNGNSVKLGDLGIFSLHAKTQIESEASQVTWRSFRSLVTRFRPGKALKIFLSDVNFTNVSTS
jgi:predicted histone-like DNA-binding protein